MPQVESREHPLKILGRQPAVTRVLQKIAVVVPIDEVVPNGGQKDK